MEGDKLGMVGGWTQIVVDRDDLCSFVASCWSGSGSRVSIH